MKVSVHFFQVNSDFSPEHAAAHHNGEESENNLKYDWEDELEVSQSLEKVEVERNAVFHLEGQFADGKAFNEAVPNMFLVVLILKGGQKGYMGVSESMLLDFEQEGTPEHTVIRIYIRDYEPFWNEMPGIFIASKEFPKSLKLNDLD